MRRRVLEWHEEGIDTLTLWLSVQRTKDWSREKVCFLGLHTRDQRQ
jgi:hypothetical protein